MELRTSLNPKDIISELIIWFLVSFLLINLIKLTKRQTPSNKTYAWFVTIAGITCYLGAASIDLLDEFFKTPYGLKLAKRLTFIGATGLTVHGIVAWAKHSTRLVALLHSKAVTDPLTGLYNRRFFFEQLEIELARARALRTSLAVLVMDIDDFKLVNDNLGHMAGDELLVSITQGFRHRIRKSDIICRYGGDEFALILPGTDLEGAKIVARSLKTFLDNEVHLSGIDIGLSIGIAVFPQDGTTADELINTADERMYEQKSQQKQKEVL